MTALKDFLNAIHAVVHTIAHVALILPLAALKSVDAGLQHLIVELQKI